ncbi:MAG: CPBP family intramembrane metalloprotease, partial [Bacillota bacterium]|nr:CPBP family intramembrane metalloprotease [Bacillota bacterium]
ASEKLAVPLWLIFSFSITLMIVLFLLRKEIRSTRLERNGQPATESIGWAIGGFFLALLSQMVCSIIEKGLGIHSGSENTKLILQIIETFPLAIFVSSIFGPILEEIVFRKIIFGSLHKRLNFFLSALISSLIFAAAHMEFQHLLLYAGMGFTFAFLYVKTKNILVPMFAHVAMNTFVVIIQLAFKNDLDKMIHHTEKIQSFIGGFL